jgi:predicted GNAT family acetyltransferase
VSEIDVLDNPEARRYEARVGEALAGFITYRSAGDVVTMIHTEVLPEWEGHGVGSALVRGALDDVRARGLEVRPLCPFVAGYLRHHPEYEDLVVS